MRERAWIGGHALYCRAPMRRLILFLALCLLPASALARGAVAAAHPDASEAGAEILREGGSATDAALAMMLALTVVEPQSSGIGGGGFLVRHDGTTGIVRTIDGRETAPAAARADRFLGEDGEPIGFREAFQGGHAVGVPGNVALMAQAHARWGRLPWARLFEPAIRLAGEGFEVNERLHGFLVRFAPLWERFPEARAIYHVDGRPAPAGAVIRNPALAGTLRLIAEQGAEAFYRGPVAAEIAAKASEAEVNPAPLTLADLAAYEAKLRPAVCGRYRAYKICGMGPPSSGPITAIQILGMIERFGIGAMGPRDPRAWHILFEAMRLAYADREQWLADRDFIAVPVAGLIDRAYLARRSALISPRRARRDHPHGTPPGAGRRSAAEAGERGGTSHFVAVDGEGNIVSMTSTVEAPFGSQLVAGGFFLNNELTDFSFAPERGAAPVANRVEPGKRPLSSMTPVIVYDAGNRPVLALGSAGGKRIIMHVVKTLIGVLDWDLPVAEAIALPNIYFDEEAAIVEEGTFLAAMEPALEALSGPVEVAEQNSGVHALQRTAEGWVGAADPRRPGVAIRE